MRAGGASGRARSRASSDDAHADEREREQRPPRSAGAAPAGAAPRAAARRASGPATASACAAPRARRCADACGRNRHDAGTTLMRTSQQSRMRRDRRHRAAVIRAPVLATCDARAVRAAQARTAAPRAPQASTHAVSRDRRCSSGSDRGSASQVEHHRTAAAGAVELLGEPARAARDRLPRDALRRIAALEFAQAREIGVVARALRQRIGAAVRRAAAAARRSRRRDTRCRRAGSARTPSRARGRAGTSDDSVTRPSGDAAALGRVDVERDRAAPARGDVAARACAAPRDA